MLSNPGRRLYVPIVYCPSFSDSLDREERIENKFYGRMLVTIDASDP